MSNIKEVHGKHVCLCQPIIWSMAAMLRASAAVRTRPRGNTASHDNHEKINSWDSFSFSSYMGMGLRLSALRAAGAPLLLL